MNKIALAEIIGNKAFKNGLDCKPSIDSECTALLATGSISATHKENMSIMKAWLKGWMNANLAA